MPQLRYGIKSKIIYYTENEILKDYWTYNTETNGQITLYKYTGSYNGTVAVPKAAGKTAINNWVSGAASGTTDANRLTPFYNNPSVKNADLQGVPFVSNNMYRAFSNCRNLISVYNINPNVTNMAYTFSSCHNLNQNIQIPNSVTSMPGTFYYCTNLNQNIQIPSSVTSMTSTFNGCLSLNQNIQIPNSVTNMAYTFYYCTNLNQNIQIPNSVTDMYSTFRSCINLNQNITILSNKVTNAISCFSGTSALKNVFIPFKNSDTTNSATFNSFVSAGYLTSAGVSTGINGVTVYDLNGGTAIQF